jgi:peroxiredoxin
VGISTDFLPTQQAWAEKMGLTFPLLSDVSRQTLEAYRLLETDPKNRLYR